MTYALSMANLDMPLYDLQFRLHILSGMSMIMTGLWLTINVLRRHYRSVLSDGRIPFQIQLWYVGPWTTLIPLDSAVRFICWSPLALISIYYCSGNDPEAMHHIILSTGVMMGAAVEIATCISGRCRKRSTAVPPLLPGADRAVSVLSAGVVYFVFHFHFHGEAPLQTHLHNYLPWLAAGLLLSHPMEVLGRNHLWMALARPYATLMLGVWLWQISFIIFFPGPWPRSWEDDSMASFITADFLLCCHLLMTFLLVLVVAVFIRRSEMTLAKVRVHTNHEEKNEASQTLLANGV